MQLSVVAVAVALAAAIVFAVPVQQQQQQQQQQARQIVAVGWLNDTAQPFDPSRMASVED
ncbi:uncharacterized protein UV8b_01721 [Ustilaginoidea virens]|uniref:Uncharacterized protein n=1 Tax=Ustilaginoidea virens TaxID=1159556 RepID=A0A8E5HL56_USTVR|nr:uncharacterized protein UV8b_01721 [Ustilaginoidea virens]QUC17480.1 hypothetical protein UV8b_01721 [Ustilaginoidea virens]